MTQEKEQPFSEKTRVCLWTAFFVLIVVYMYAEHMYPFGCNSPMFKYIECTDKSTISVVKQLVVTKIVQPPPINRTVTSH